MKKYLGFLLLISVFANAQKDSLKYVSPDDFHLDMSEAESNIKKNVNYERSKIYSINDVSEMAIFPGCDEFKGSNEKLNSCMLSKISDYLFTDPTFEPYPEFLVQLEFSISKNGGIYQVKPISEGNIELERKAKASLERYATRLISRGQNITSAKLDDGTEVALKMILPLRKSKN